MKKEVVVKQIWLLYFNQTLFQKQLITMQEYQKMRRWILRLNQPASA